MRSGTTSSAVPGAAYPEITVAEPLEGETVYSPTYIYRQIFGTKMKGHHQHWLAERKRQALYDIPITPGVKDRVLVLKTAACRTV